MPRTGASRNDNAVEVALLRGAGWSTTEIAKEMGLSRSYVSSLLSDPEGIADQARKDSYRKPCPECGKFMTGSGGKAVFPKRCRDCANKDPHNKKWTRENVIAAIQHWHETRGKPPMSQEWLYAGADKMTDPDGYRYPYTSTVQTIFGKWNNAIEAAGFEVKSRGWKRPIAYNKNEFAVLRRLGSKWWEVVAIVPQKAHGWSAVVEVTTVEERRSNDYMAIPMRYFRPYEEGIRHRDDRDGG